MTILVFAVIAFLVGTLLGLCFNVFVLFPAVICSLAAIAGVGFKYESSLGFVVFIVFLGITTLQMGYLFGSVIAAYVGDAQEQKRRLGVVETVQRLFRQSHT